MLPANEIVGRELGLHMFQTILKLLVKTYFYVGVFVFEIASFSLLREVHNGA
jgi:hypothetical protein